jgi:CheY-like chemotaxis protein
MAKYAESKFGMAKPVLVAEDFEPDAEALQSALKRAGVTNPVFVVGDGDRAIAYLKGEGIFSDRELFPPPGILILDLKMPGRGGMEVLEWCKRQRQLEDLLVVVVSGYNHILEIKQAYELGAATFLTKPVRDEDIANLIRAFKNHWEVLSPTPPAPQTSADTAPKLSSD